MKKLFFFSTFLLIVFGCSKFDVEKFPQKWQLVRMYSNQVPNAGITDSSLEYQEYYLLNSDGTFTKLREVDGITTEASGSFMIIENEWGKSFEFTFSRSDDPLIESCTHGKEVFWIKSERTMSGTWSYCDGPVLEYQRVE